MENNSKSEQATNIFGFINNFRAVLDGPLSGRTMDNLNSLLESIEVAACKMADEIVALKTPSNNCFINLSKNSKQSATFCRPYYFNSVHAGNIHYMVEHFRESNFSRVGDVIDSMDSFISSRFIEEITPSRDTYGCLRFSTSDARALINSDSVVAITESKCNRGATAVIHLSSGKSVDTDHSYEAVVSAYLAYRGKERGTVKRPAGI